MGKDIRLQQIENLRDMAACHGFNRANKIWIVHKTHYMSLGDGASFNTMD